ncbi:iron-containing alcohol dehydrogenase family protein [Eubacteriaceae bacterium ES2]|nr:iron-containing alcohol dehydrogenase family protein [Eubacteriaceae bacterium ES2]
MTYNVNISNYRVGETAYDQVEEICSEYGKKVAVIIGNHGYYQARPYLDDELKNSSLNLSEPIYYGGNCTYENIEKLKQVTSVIEADMIFAIGGGRVVDTAKLLGEKVKKPVFAFPTIASNCSPCTSVSIMYDEKGAFIRPEFLKDPPICAFIHTSLLAKAPIKYLWAGLGDTYAKYYEASISARGDELSHPLSLGVHISRQCAESVLKHGLGALRANETGVVNDDFEQAALTIIVTTAWVSILVTLSHTPDYNSGLAHAIYYTLTTVPGFDEEKHLHGEMVAFGVLILLLIDGQETEFKKVYAFNKEAKLPCRLADLELDMQTMENYLDAVTKMGDISHNPYQITVEMLREAFVKLEAMN